MKIQGLNLNEGMINEDLKSISQKIYSQEIMEVHHEFDFTTKKLLSEAKEILNLELNAELLKARRLDNVGFFKAKRIPDADLYAEFYSTSKEEEELKRKERNRKIKMAERILYYQFNYPNNKFISYEHVEAICRKYNLVCGEVGRYMGFVPEANLQLIENFRIKEEDTGKISDYGNFIYKNGYRDKRESTGMFTLEFKKAPLEICAPQKDMDMKGATLYDGYKINPKKSIIPDPIVLQPVEYGYLIITAWGDEASDELVVNPKHN